MKQEEVFKKNRGGEGWGLLGDASLFDYPKSLPRQKAYGAISHGRFPGGLQFPSTNRPT